MCCCLTWVALVYVYVTVVIVLCPKNACNHPITNGKNQLFKKIYYDELCDSMQSSGLEMCELFG